VNPGVYIEHKKRKKTIKFSTLRRLSFCNSPKCPQRVIHEGVVKEWVGFGWITINDQRRKPSDVYVVED
jgi:hypothetical protein